VITYVSTYLSYEIEKVSYETLNFSYETEEVSYENAAVSYERFANSYEMITVSYEKFMVSYETLIASHNSSCKMSCVDPVRYALRLCRLVNRCILRRMQMTLGPMSGIFIDASSAISKSSF